VGAAPIAAEPATAGVQPSVPAEDSAAVAVGGAAVPVEVTLGAAAVSTPASVPAPAVPATPTEPPIVDVGFDVGLVPSLSISGRRAKGARVRNHSSIAVLWSRSDELKGFALALGWTYVVERAQGMTAALGGNISRGRHHGAQVGLGFNMAGELHGFQGAVGFNHARTMEGLQAGSINIAKEVQGMQVGLINVGRKVRGVQVGSSTLRMKPTLRLRCCPSLGKVDSGWSSGRAIPRR